MEYLIRFVQMHETFREPETAAIADLAGIDFEWLSYLEDSPFAVLSFRNCLDQNAAARALLSRSILGMAIYELWGTGHDYTELHRDVRKRTESLWANYQTDSFRFEVDCFHGSRTTAAQRRIIEDFAYMDFQGPIVMHDPDHQFTIFEEYSLNAPMPRRLYFGRLVAESGRKAINKYNLKKRRYIATTSMDAELSLVTANLAQAAPGRLIYDPFMGTGSFPLACAHFGATVFGSDLDGRSIRGDSKSKRNVQGNFEQYATSAQYLGGFVADLTNTPFRAERCLDAIVCDPPYGVREGLKVLGSTRPALKEIVYLSDGTPAHLQNNYIPPKKPYSFLRMLDDILDFAAERLVDAGRLCMWMPVAGVVEGEDHVESTATKLTSLHETEYDIPSHPALKLVSVCTQDFNKWSRRLLTYSRKPDASVDEAEMLAYRTKRLAVEGDATGLKQKADDLNLFRKKYFQGFKDSPSEQGISGSH